MQIKDKTMTLKDAKKVISQRSDYEDGQLNFPFVYNNLDTIVIKTKEDKDKVVETACKGADKDVRRVLKINSNTADNNSKEITKEFKDIDKIEEEIKALRELKNEKIKNIAFLMLANKDIIDYIIELATPCIQEKNRRDLEKIDNRIERFEDAKRPELIKLTSQEESDLKEFIALHNDIIESTGFKGLIEYIDKEIDIALKMQGSKYKASQYKLLSELLKANCLIK